MTMTQIWAMLMIDDCDLTVNYEGIIVNLIYYIICNY